MNTCCLAVEVLKNKNNGCRKFNCAIEGKHFEIMPDGEIRWIENRQ